MSELPRCLRAACLTFLFLVLVPSFALATTSDPCPRPAEGSVITSPPDLYSANGVLTVALNYYTSVDQWGRTLFCYTTPDGLEAPTLHVNPGDTLNITLTNDEISPKGHGQGSAGTAFSVRSLGSGVETISGAGNACGDTTMSVLSANMHFHGLNVTPACHSDEVIR